MKNKKILIGMQAVHKSDVLKDMTCEALGSITYDGRWSVLVDDTDTTLAEKWNYAIQQALDKDFDYVVLVNNDVLFLESTFNNLVEFIDTHNYDVVSATQYFDGEDPHIGDGVDESHLHWSFVILDPRLVKDVGFVETRLQRGSFVDTEWEIRMRKLDKKLARTESSWFFHYNDTTHRLLPEYKDSFDKNHGIVKEKWGAQYKYDYPYNDPKLPMTFVGERK